MSNDKSAEKRAENWINSRQWSGDGHCAIYSGTRALMLDAFLAGRADVYSHDLKGKLVLTQERLENYLWQAFEAQDADGVDRESIIKRIIKLAKEG